MMRLASKSRALLFVTFYCIPFLTCILGTDYHTKLLLLHLLAHFIAKLHNDVNFRKITIINNLSICFSFPLYYIIPSLSMSWLSIRKG